MKQKALLISLAFPPIAEAESYLVAKSLSSLTDFEIDVLTLEPNTVLHRVDHALDNYIKEKFSNIVRCPVPYDFYMRLRGKLPFLSQTPDLYKGIIKKINKLVLSAHQRENYKIVISWSNWLTSHLSALYLKNKYPDLPWIAHFSDPWIGNPYVGRSQLVNALNKRLQDKVFNTAEALTFTSDIAADYAQKNTKIDISAKSYSIPHCYDKNFYTKGEVQDQDKIIFRYIGNFYGHRTPLFLFNALGKLDPSSLRKIKVEFIGSTPAIYFENEYFKALPNDVVLQRNPVSYVESLSFMQSADVLLLIDAPAEKSVFLPSKLIDYIGAEKPILGLTPEGVSQDVLKQFGHTCIYPDKPDEIAKALGMCIKNKNKHNQKSQGDARRQFDVERVRATYNDLLKRFI